MSIGYPLFVIVFYFVGGGGLWLAKKIFQDDFNPVSLYIAVWSVVVLFLQFSWLSKAVIFDGLLWKVFFLGHFCFLLGAFTGAVGVRTAQRRPQYPRDGCHNLSTNFLLNRQVLFKLILWLFLIGAISVFVRVYSGTLQIAGSFANFWRDPFVVRTHLIGRLHENAVSGATLGRALLVSLTTASMFLATMLSGVYAALYGYRFVAILPLVAGFVQSILTLQRYVMVVYIVFFGAGFITYFKNAPRFSSACDSRRKRTRQPHTRSRRLMAVILFVAVPVTVLVNAALLDTASRWIAVGPPSFPPLAKVTMWYVGGPVLGLNQYLASGQSGLSWGVSTGRAISEWLVRLGVIDRRLLTPIHYDFVDVGLRLINVFTWFRPFYEDFGLLGIMLFPYLIGEISSVVYFLLKARFSLARLAAYSLIVLTLAMSFYNFAIRDTVYLLTWLGAITLDKACVAYCGTRRHSALHLSTTNQVTGIGR